MFVCVLVQPHKKAVKGFAKLMNIFSNKKAGNLTGSSYNNVHSLYFEIMRTKQQVGISQQCHDYTAGDGKLKNMQLQLRDDDRRRSVADPDDDDRTNTV